MTGTESPTTNPTFSPTINLTPAHRDRGEYNKLESPSWLVEIISELEGTAFETGFSGLDRRGGYSAINTDCYGFATVLGQELAVIQVRSTSRRKRGYFLQIRKDYYLVGRNENGNAFAHPVDSPCRSKRALETVEGPVLKVLAEIWRCDAEDVLRIQRNGDVAFVPVTARSIPSDVIEVDAVGLAGSHVVEAGRGGRLYYSPSAKTHFAKRSARISHAKHQHPTAVVDSGTWRIEVARRASHWGFTRPTAD